MSRDVISDEAWAAIEPLFPTVKDTGCPPVDRRTAVEATTWRFRTGAPWRDVPEKFGNWNTIYKNCNRWSEQGVWTRVLEKTRSLAQQSGDLEWVASIDSTIVRMHQHGAALPRTTGAPSNYKKFRDEPPDHAIGRSRGGLTTKSHLVCDGKGRSLAFVLTPPEADGCHEHDGGHARADPGFRRSGSSADSPGPGEGRQGIPVEGELGLAARARDRCEDPGAR